MLLDEGPQEMLYTMQSLKHTLLWDHLNQRVVSVAVLFSSTGLRGRPEE